MACTDINTSAVDILESLADRATIAQGLSRRGATLERRSTTGAEHLDGCGSIERECLDSCVGRIPGPETTITNHFAIEATRLETIPTGVFLIQVVAKCYENRSCRTNYQGYGLSGGCLEHSST